MTFTCSSNHFNLAQIADSGQCFRMNRIAENTYSVISAKKHVLVSQNGDCVSLDCPQENFSFWKSYFDLDTDYHAFIESIDPKDSYLTSAARFGGGIRILRQDLWEMLITFVISQQKTIPMIQKLVEALCTAYGSPLADGSGFAFPTPKELSKASLDDLLTLKLGYRAKYIKRLADEAADGTIDLAHLKTLSYPEAFAYLTNLYGIGKKVANCVCLFGLHHIGAFPVDTWIERILLREYFDEKKYRHIAKSHLNDVLVEDHFAKYSGYAGVLQQYIFFYERSLT